MLIDIFVMADSKEDAVAVAQRNTPGLQFTRTYAVAAERATLSEWAYDWSRAMPSRRVDVVGSLGRYAYRVSGEVR